MAPPKQKTAAGRKRKIVSSSESESTSPNSSSSDEAGPLHFRNTKAVRQLRDDSDDGSSTISTLSIANSTKPKNSARKSTATRPRPQSSSSDQASNIGARNATRPGQNTATTSRRQIESDSEDDSEEEYQKPKQGNSSKQNNSNKATPNRTARQLNFATSSQNTTPTPRKKGRPPLKTKLATATKDSNSSRTKKKPVAATNASDESSDEEIVRPTPNARNNIAPRNFSPISKKLGPYSPFKKPSSDVATIETKKQLVNSCIHYLLIVDQKKYAIKKADLKKNIFKDNCSTKVFNEVILEVNKTLKQVFGLELMELENKKDQYMIHNNLHNALELAEFSEKMQAERGLLIYLLTLIFMNGNAILEEDLWTSLKTFQLFRDPKKPHPCFGEVSKFLDKLERQMYLERAKIPNSEPTLSEYKWGLRAKLEVRKTDLLEFACSAYGDCNPEDWILQFKETALENEDSAED